MDSITVNMGLLVTVACLALTITGAGVAVVFAKKTHGADNIGTVLSIFATAPFFFSLCYLVVRIIIRVGAAI